MTTAPRWEWDPGTLWHEVHNAVLVLPSGASAPLALRGTGATAWLAFGAPQTVDDVAASVAERFGAPEPTVRADLDLFVERMTSCGALRRTP